MLLIVKWVWLIGKWGVVKALYRVVWSHIKETCI